ncbi:hypothetical protein CXX78_01325 [Candidatus Parvarchaeota archaeon]|nr:MAG: hypothetical protein CXX78_01325 [Candidatus Parvarchaeota archaeon]
MIVMVINLNFVFSLSITEVELNPPGLDSGNEWVELYSEEEVNLGNYFLENNDQDIINLTGSFRGYYIINFEKQWLDNSDERVFLKSGEITIDTSIFKDSQDNSKTWNLCSGEWTFLDSTKNEENSCSEIPENSNPVDGETDEEVTIAGEALSELENETRKINFDMFNENDELIGQANMQPTKIILHSETEKSEDFSKSSEIFETKDEKIRKAMLYSFMFLCIVLIILLVLSKF